MPRKTQTDGPQAYPTLLRQTAVHPQDLLAQAARAEAQGDWQAAATCYAQGLERRSAELAFINSVQEALSSQLQMQAIYDLVGDRLRDTFDAQVVMISQYDPQTRTVFHHYAIERGRHLQIRTWQPVDSSRSEIVRTHRLKMNASGVFVTLLYCVLDLNSGWLQYSRAGHPLPIVLDGEGQPVDVAMREGQPLGVFEDVRIDQQQFLIPAGGLALLYSDGLSEATDVQGCEYGLRQVYCQLSASRRESAKAICKRLWHAVQDHCGPIPRQDDFTAVIVKRCFP